MDIDTPLDLLGGRTPREFAQRHWHKRPLLIRQAVPGIVPPLARQALFELAADESVESRLLQQGGPAGWSLRHGPFAKRQLPAVSTPGWTLLVQGLDLHLDAAHELLSRFRFLPDARLDDLMISWASDGGGVGPHVDSYDVFLLQVSGRRRWRIGRPVDTRLRPDLPVKILARFEPEQEWLLEPGDMLYLPPHWAHDGVAEGECMTCSIGYRASTRGEHAHELLQALADTLDDELEDEPDSAMAKRYADPKQPATVTPARIPPALQGFALDALERLLREPRELERMLGERLSEPKPGVAFEPPASRRAPSWRHGLVLDRRSRMLYDERCLYLNGESWRAGGADARLMRALADDRGLSAAQLAQASSGALELLREWHDAGWLHARRPAPVPHQASKPRGTASRA